MKYVMNEARFDLPGAWEDQSAVILTTPGPDDSKFGLVVERHVLTEEQTLLDLVNERSRGQMQSLRGHRMLGQREAVVAGAPAWETKLRWRHDEGTLFHHMAYVETPECVLIFTASSLVQHAEACERWMTSLLDSLELRAP